MIFNMCGNSCPRPALVLHISSFPSQSRRSFYTNLIIKSCRSSNVKALVSMECKAKLQSCLNTSDLNSLIHHLIGHLKLNISRLVIKKNSRCFIFKLEDSCILSRRTQQNDLDFLMDLKILS